MVMGESYMLVLGEDWGAEGTSRERNCLLYVRSLFGTSEVSMSTRSTANSAIRSRQPPARTVSSTVSVVGRLRYLAE